ncbi:hypothetical protein R1sor_013541 [Riccia sorocarpa]|uniref:Uncharacterized protein n=1 Tax=Riccia sorocarpa TaxID=122646 RepID=A0ABD3H9G8_9MARC
MQLAVAATEDITLGLAVGSWVGGNVPGGAYDVRVPLLLILIGKGSAYHAGLAEVGVEEFFSNNGKLFENPYLQMRGVLQLSSECDSPSFQSES